MPRIPMNELIEFGVSFMTKRGVPEDRARAVSEIVVETEAFRQSSHGIVQYQGISRTLGKEIDPQAEPKIVRDHGATATLDGDRSLGNLSMKLARELVVKKARQFGVGFVGVRNTAWIGGLGMHIVSIARQGLLATAWAQTNTCLDCAPYGGIDARFSTNPIAIAFPTSGDPVVADFSTATMSMGGAHSLIKQGRKTETQRFIDSAGRLTDDPSVLKEGGTLMFAGGDVDGHKFYALSLFIEALTVLAGGSANNPDMPSHQSFSVMALDQTAFAGGESYMDEMQRFVTYLKSARARPGFEQVRLPGQRGFAALEDCRAHGVPLDETKLQMLRSIAKDNGLDAPPGV